MMSSMTGCFCRFRIHVTSFVRQSTLYQYYRGRSPCDRYRTADDDVVEYTFGIEAGMTGYGQAYQTRKTSVNSQSFTGIPTYTQVRTVMVGRYGRTQA